MPMLADTVELVIGVDTHTAAVVQAVSGAVVDQVTVPATPAGYQQLLRFADDRTVGGCGRSSQPPPRRQVRPPGRDQGGP
jgi:hypothetical protein